MADDATVLGRVQELAWALVDGEITKDEARLLDTLLLSDEAARKHYLDCMKLHADLALHYAKPAAPAASSGASKSPVLGFLNSGTWPLGLQMPPAEDATS